MAKAIWTGSIAFGLVNIPVKMYSAISETTLDLDMLDKADHAPIKYKRVNEKTGKEVEWKDIVKGYEINGNYVVLDDDDFEKASAEKTKRIEINSFVKQAEIDPIYYDNSYYLEPDKNNAHAYLLLKNAMGKTGMVALGNYVMRNKENLCIIKVYQELLMLTKIHFENELKDWGELNIPKKDTKPNNEELKMAVNLIKNMEKPFDISKIKDEYTAQLLKFIEEKAKGKKTKTVKAKPLPKEVTNLMDQLKASLLKPIIKKKSSAKRTPSLKSGVAKIKKKA